MVRVFFMSPYVALHFLRFQENPWNIFKLQKGHKYMTGITIYNVQRVVTSNTDNSELWFLCTAHHIMVIHICKKFQENISNSFQVTERIHILQKWLVQRAKTPKVGKPELRFISSTNRVKFHQNMWKGFQLTERTLVLDRNGCFQYLLCSKGLYSKSRVKIRVILLVFCR